MTEVFIRGISTLNITEDDCFDDHDTAEQEKPQLTESEVPLLYSPLPLDLPKIDKDPLILMAAYEGNVDRYARLRRPKMIPEEAESVIRGIYHNTTFAKWWSLEIKSCTAEQFREFDHRIDIKRAINARFIMNNDLSLVFDFPEPYMIWYPLWPQRETLVELVERVPSMRLQAAHTCIFADYRMLYDKLQVRPCWILWQESRNSHDPYYKADLERRVAELRIDVAAEKYKSLNINVAINRWCTNRDKEPTDRVLWQDLGDCQMTDSNYSAIYGSTCEDGYQVNAKDFNLFICATAAMRAELPKDEDGWALYEEYE
jgi:hypothetical protein